MVKIEWNDEGFRNVVAQGMENLAVRGRGRLRYVRCPVHKSVHAVTWETHGEVVNAVVKNACCDELKKTLFAEAQKAIG